MTHGIQIDPFICHGKPTVTGTRVLASTILSSLGGEDSIRAVFEDYPNLKEQDISAAFEFASELSQFEDILYERDSTISRSFTMAVTQENDHRGYYSSRVGSDFWSCCRTELPEPKT